VPGSICEVLPSAAAVLGVPGAIDTLGLADSLGDVDRVAVVLVDGLGWHLLPELVGDAPLLASVLTGATGRLRQLVCTFPSTTPTSLVSLGTGAQPGEHEARQLAAVVGGVHDPIRLQHPARPPALFDHDERPPTPRALAP